MYSINRLFFLSLGSVCFLIVPFFWLALALDFSALENFVVKLSTTEFVGYPIPELLGAQKNATVIDQVLRIKIFFTVLVVAYSLFFVALSRVEGSRKRNNYCARGLAVPLFILILGFWFKFIGDDHIISKEEKTELFQYTTGCFIISVMMLTYSFRSVKKVKPQKEEVTETPKTSSTEKKEVESGQDLATKEGDEKVPPEAELAGAEPDESVAESEALPPPDALDPADEPPPLPSVDAASNDGEAQSQDGGLANNEFVENHGSESPPLNPTDPEAPSS